MLKTINGATFRKMLLNAAKFLDSKKEHVDALNVFPVPDGDTGTNMSLTMMSVAKEITACPSNNIDALSNALSKGALKGARGNSGVILSQIFKGMSSVLSQHSEITPKFFAKALNAGAEVAYKAVTKPKEGTILTVVREIGNGATKAVKKSISIDDFFKEILEVGESVLKQTPEMLPVLKKAGVVDAGGRGLLIVLQGFYNVVTGNEDYSIEFEDSFKTDAADDINGQFHLVDFNDLAKIEFAYCTEFSIINLNKKTTEADIDKFRENLVGIGDCVLVIGDLSMVKVHVHTNEPGVALTYALELGEVDKIKVENMLEQNRALISKQKEELKECGMVAVCAGSGLISIFRELLVDSVIEGGQTMNPSAEDIALACDKVAAKDIFVFPNNKNIILAAEQAKHLSKRNIHVIPTKSIPQGISAALAFNPEDSADNNFANMSAAFETIKAGLVTYAVRSTQIDNLDLKEGDIIGIDSKTIVAKGEKVEKVTTDLIDKMMDSSVNTIMLYFGNDIKEEDAQQIADELRVKYKQNNVDVGIHFGGQPLYYYIISLE